MSTVKNTAHSSHVLEILEYGLAQGCFSDVTISVSGSKKVIKCHKAILANSSPFLRGLFEGQEQEPLYLHLSGLSFNEAMAMMNLVYVGSVKLAKDQLERTRLAAKTFLDISVDVEPVTQRSGIKRPPSDTSRLICLPKRPLRVKSNIVPSPQPIILVMPSSSTPASPIRSDASNRTCDNNDNVSEADLQNMNSYQKAKIRCADKFKCNTCGKGFPLGCLLQRHKKTHSDVKPFPCSYCKKSFSSKTSYNHHMFMRHLEEQTEKIEQGKKLLEALRQKRKDDILDNGVVGGGQVIKVMSMSENTVLNVLNEARENTKHIENAEIIGVQDITQQIAVQMEESRPNRETVIEVVDSRGNVSMGQLIPQEHKQGDSFCPDSAGLYYIEGESNSNQYWGYKT